MRKEQLFSQKILLRTIFLLNATRFKASNHLCVYNAMVFSRTEKSFFPEVINVVVFCDIINYIATINIYQSKYESTAFKTSKQVLFQGNNFSRVAAEEQGNYGYCLV